MTYQEEKQKRSELYINLAKQFPGATVLHGAEGDIRHIQLAEGGGLWLRYDARKNRVEVSGLWPRSEISGDNSSFTPRDISKGVECANITIDAAKPMESIARDITRRFLPAYRAQYIEAAQRRDAWDATSRQVNANLQEFAALLPKGRISQQRDTHHGTVYIYELGEAKIGSDYAEIKISLDLAKARKLAAFLKTL